MHAYLIYGSTKLKREQSRLNLLNNWQVNKFDIIEISKTGISISIAQIREAQSRIYLRPLGGKFNAILISEADYLTLEAQQALLKTLEEPPRHSKIILEADDLSKMIPTIISRCQLVKISSSVKSLTAEKLTVSVALLTALTTETIGKRLAIIDSFTLNRETAIRQLEELIITARVKLLASFDNKILNQIDYFRLLRLLLAAYSKLKSNQNSKLVLDQAFCQI